VQKGLFFRGAGSLPFGNQIRPVIDLITQLLSEVEPVNYGYADN
jgi:nitronate monooxygenase